MLRPILALAALALPAAAMAKAPPGIWQNPKGNVRVQFRDCGRGAICGRVVYASADAEAKVREAGGPPLRGSDLFDGFEQTGPNTWDGEILVPDLGQAFAGTITQTGPRRLVGEGCLFAGFGCKQQVWTRVK